MEKENMTPRLRFPEFAGDWEQRKLEECFDERVERRLHDDEELLSVTISDGVIRQVDSDKKNTASSDTSNYKMVYPGDLAYNSMRMWQGAEGVSKYLGIVSPAYTVIKPKQGINSAFFAYMFKQDSMLKTFERNSQGLTSDTWNLKYPALSKISVGVPSFEEQNSIVNVFDVFDSLITLQQRKLDGIKEYKSGMLQKMFPKDGEKVPEIRFPGFSGEWEQRKISEMSDFITKGATPTTYGFDWVDEGIPFFRNDAIKDNQFVYGNFSYISEETNEALSRSEITGDDILVAITGDIGKVGIVPKSIEKANINQHTARVRIVSDAVPYFVYQSLASEEQQKIYQKIKTGLSMPQLSLEQIRATTILCPSIEEQTKIADTLSNLDKTITLQQRKLDEMKEYKKGLLQQMFV